MTEHYYDDDMLLQLSGIQHFAFCRRQWALIHIENQWGENLHTVEGDILHERTHNAMIREKRGKIITTRGLYVCSHTLGISGACDVVEFVEDEDGITLQGEKKKYKPIPVEYKRGKAKPTTIDEVQLAAQAMCLEEMLLCKIDFGYLYYGEPRRREKVDISDTLRQEVKALLLEMHQMFSREYTPKVKKTKACSNCSLVNLCLPKLGSEQTAKEYIEKHLSKIEVSQ